MREEGSKGERERREEEVPLVYRTSFAYKSLQRIQFVLSFSSFLEREREREMAVNNSIRGCQASHRRTDQSEPLRRNLEPLMRFSERVFFVF